MLHSVIGTGHRREHRDEVHHRTTAVDDAGTVHPILVVNLSPGGLMARCDAAIPPDALLTIRLPGIGAVAAQVRWVLGGRIGCALARPIDPAAYAALLGRIR